MTGTQFVRVGSADPPRPAAPSRAHGLLPGDDELSVRRVEKADLASLSAVTGNHRYYADRFHRQEQGLGVLLAAWRSGRPVGDVYLWLEEAEEAPIRSGLPGVPLLTHLEVRPDDRNQGIGSALIASVEEHVVALDRSRPRLALAVRTDNPAATRLYRRLGYRDWRRGTVVCQAERTLPGGWVVIEPERCRVLVKNLG